MNDDDTICTACRMGVCSQHQPPAGRRPRSKEVDHAFDSASSALVKAVYAAPDGDQVALVSLALDMRTMAWMINSNVKAESFVAFLEGALAQVRRNLGEIQAISDKLTNETERD